MGVICPSRVGPTGRPAVGIVRKTRRPLRSDEVDWRLSVHSKNRTDRENWYGVSGSRGTRMTQPAGGRTREKLEAKTSEERFRVWSNARAKGPLEAEELARFIEESGLNYAPFGGVSMSDPRVLEMRAVIESPEGEQPV